MLVVHNEKILDFIKYRYSLEDIQRLSAFLSENDVLSLDSDRCQEYSDFDELFSKVPKAFY